MTAAWRKNVPCAYIFGSLNGQPQDNVNRFKPTVGKDITHRLATGSSELISFVVPFSYDEFQEFKEMYKVDFADGSLNFSARDPVTGITKFFQFAEPYTWAKVASNRFHVGMSLIEGPEE